MRKERVAMPNIWPVRLLKCITVYSLCCWLKNSEELTRNCKQSALKKRRQRDREFVQASALQYKVRSRISMHLNLFKDIYK